jgi:hypothetical protein
MPDDAVSRREMLHSLALAIPVARGGLALGSPRTWREQDVIRLQPQPTRLYKTADFTREQTESWIFWLFVEADRMRTLVPATLQLTCRSKERVIKTTALTADALAPLVLHPPAPTARMDGSPLRAPAYRPLGIRIRCSEPIASAIDALDVTLTLREGTQSIDLKASYPVETYVQKTPLIFPYRGNGIITQAGVTNGGHRNRSGQFAVDAVGLNEAYGVYDGPSTSKSADYADWGRTIIAPADGAVVVARADRPDQPDPEKSDPAFYVPEYPNGGDPGNHVVISHGNGEFSMIAHFQAGSLLVRKSDRVTQGQALGKLGSSGDTVTPHVHYQLQAGADWQFADGLPVAFTNVHEGQLVRGTFFSAK